MPRRYCHAALRVTAIRCRRYAAMSDYAAAMRLRADAVAFIFHTF